MHPTINEVLRALADGKDCQISMEPTGDWRTLTPVEMLRFITNNHMQPERFRVKPQVVMINGHEVPAPLPHDVAPEVGSMVYLPDIADPVDPQCGFNWRDCTAHLRQLEAGILHATSAAARAHGHALLSFTKR